MTFRKVVSLMIVLAVGSFAAAQDLPQPGDVVFGLSVADPDMTMELVRGPVGTMTGVQLNDPWNNEIFIQGVQFDNLNGMSHNASGNLLGVNFGSTPDPDMMTGGGVLYNFATTSNVAAGQPIADSWGTGGAITPTRMAGLSVSPDNTKVAVAGYDSQRVLIYDYTAGDPMGSGAALSNVMEVQPLDFLGDPGLTGFDTQGTAWLDNDTVVVFSTFGDLFEIDVATGNSTTAATILTPFVGSDLTQIEYNPAVSPLMYIAYSGFAGATTNQLYIVDPNDSYSIVNTVDLSTSVNTIRDIAFDADGNLYFTSFGGDNADPGPYLDVLVGAAADPAGIADNSTIQFYRSGVDSGFNGIDIAHGTSTPGIDGDFNDDGVYDGIDVDGLVEEIIQVAGGGSADASFDLDGDGTVDTNDLVDWLAEAGTALGFGSPILDGDANVDGTVDGADFLAWNANKFDTGGFWTGGDFNADGTTDGADFLIWNGNKFTSSDVQSVPEPAAGLLSLLAMAFVWARRR